MSSAEAAFPALKAQEGDERGCGDWFETTQGVTTISIEIEGGSKPALVADWVTRTVFDS